MKLLKLGQEMQSRRRLAVGAVLIILLGCQTTIPVQVAAPGVEMIASPGQSWEHLEAGRDIYVDKGKCASCHEPKPVYEHKLEAWTNDILPRMAKKAKLDSDEYEAVLAYITLTTNVYGPGAVAK